MWGDCEVWTRTERNIRCGAAWETVRNRFHIVPADPESHRITEFASFLLCLTFVFHRTETECFRLFFIEIIAKRVLDGNSSFCGPSLLVVWYRGSLKCITSRKRLRSHNKLLIGLTPQTCSECFSDSITSRPRVTLSERLRLSVWDVRKRKGWPNTPKSIRTTPPDTEKAE